MQQSPTTIVGTLVADPAIKVGATGTSFTTLRIASTRRRQDADGVWSDASTVYMDVKVFKNLALNACESLRKGDEVIVVGHLVTDEWTTAEGEKRSKTLMVADAMGGSLGRGIVRITKINRSASAAPAEDGAVSLEVPADASALEADALTPSF